MSIFNKNSNSSNSSGDNSTPPNTNKNTLSGNLNIPQARTIDGSMVGMRDESGNKNKPGFLPNYTLGEDWVGNLLVAHPKSLENSKLIEVSTSDRFNESKNRTADKPYSTRDYYLLFNDPTMDYFKHGLQVLDNKNPIQEVPGVYAWNGDTKSGTNGNPNSSSENNDPVIYGFEFVIDAVSSPLLNGSVEDFITKFSSISEIRSKYSVIADFKQQLSKLVKTKGTIKVDTNDEKMASYVKPNYATTESQNTINRSGQKAYLGYYLKKVTGLTKLAEGNTSDSMSYVTDYGKDKITLSFNEDVSLTLGTLAHLYKLLYWSKPNGKSLIPENLLRFNCDIIISECRQFNRVRKAVNSGTVDIVRDNLSRYVYSLKECQFYFKSLTHDDSVDIGGGQLNVHENYDVEFDYKYSSLRFEKWVPDLMENGQYLNYDGGALWKVGNVGRRLNDGEQIDNSRPIFKKSGNKSDVKLETIDYSNITPITSDENKPEQVTLNSIKNGQSELDNTNTVEKTKFQSKIDGLKDRSKKASKDLFKSINKATNQEISRQVDIRLRLLNDSINKALGSLGMGTMSPPTNVYQNPFGIGGKANPFFFDVQKSLRNFLGDSLGGQLGSVAKTGKANINTNSAINNLGGFFNKGK